MCARLIEPAAVRRARSRGEVKGMNVKELFSHWDEVRRGLIQALDQLSDDQLHFTPREGLRALGTVACHIANAEEGWFRYVITRELEEWPAEYTVADYPTIESVKSLLAEVHSRTDTYLAGLKVEEMDRVIEAPWGESFRQGWIIWHVVEHEIHHRGEIFLMLGLLGMEAPDI
jgi:uncharacterized damage-inducible protein DinB